MLPRIDTPVYELKLPLSEKLIKFRPFLVKEQRNLLMAMESDDSDTIVKNIKQILINCTITDDIDFDELPIVDVEYYFLNLRARSSGEVVELKYVCNNEVDGKECGNSMETSVNLLEINVDGADLNKNLIDIGGDISIKLKYPRFGVVKSFDNISDITELAINMIVDSIEYIYDGEQYYYTSDVSTEELITFVESLNQSQFDKLEKFFDNLPRIHKNINVTCSKCGYNHDIHVEGLEDFFG